MNILVHENSKVGKGTVRISSTTMLGYGRYWLNAVVLSDGKRVRGALHTVFMTRSGDQDAQPWVEKYRPKRLDEVTRQEETIRALKQLLYGTGGSALVPKVASLPHLLFYGPPGTGKTTTALALCRELFYTAGSRDVFQDRVLELNASDERGIRVVREKIKRFAQGAVDDTAERLVPGFKIVILDEADAITADAQTALRRTIEVHSRTTRFILICNYLSRVIPPLTSRCAKFRFRALDDSAVASRLQYVAQSEGMPSLSPAVVALFVQAAAGDLRRAVTLLQSCFEWANLPGSQESTLTPEAVSEAACLVPPMVLQRFVELCVSDTEPVTASLSLLRGGYPLDELLRQTLDRLLLNTRTDGKDISLNDLQRAAIALHMARAEKCLCDGADEAMQLFAFIANCRAVISGGR
jgi:replication factor C subunit 2/4